MIEEVLVHITEWIQLHQHTVEWLGALSILTFIGTLIVVPLLVIRMSDDYFMIENPRNHLFCRHHPVIRYTCLFMKNILGVLFLLAGLAMLFLPGQGLITVLIGVMLMDFPRKRVLELSIIRQESILRSINWMRAKASRPPLRVPGFERV